jgi:hypothetical protein
VNSRGLLDISILSTSGSSSEEISIISSSLDLILDLGDSA